MFYDNHVWIVQNFAMFRLVRNELNAFGTLTVNVLGCFLIGFVMHIAQTTDIISADIKMAVTVGFLGALTTFSTFSMETYKYIEDSQWLLAGANVALNVVLGLIATILGLAAARLVVGGS